MGRKRGFEVGNQYARYNVTVIKIAA